MQAGGRVRHHARGEGTIVEVPRLGKVGIPGDPSRGYRAPWFGNDGDVDDDVAGAAVAAAVVTGSDAVFVGDCA